MRKHWRLAVHLKRSGSGGTELLVVVKWISAKRALFSTLISIINSLTDIYYYFIRCLSKEVTVIMFVIKICDNYFCDCIFIIIYYFLIPCAHGDLSKWIRDYIYKIARYGVEMAIRNKIFLFLIVSSRFE